MSTNMADLKQRLLRGYASVQRAKGGAVLLLNPTKVVYYTALIIPLLLDWRFLSLSCLIGRDTRASSLPFPLAPYPLFYLD